LALTTANGYGVKYIQVAVGYYFSDLTWLSLVLTGEKQKNREGTSLPVAKRKIKNKK
jgi:hypothetical protein